MICAAAAFIITVAFGLAVSFCVGVGVALIGCGLKGGKA